MKKIAVLIIFFPFFCLSQEYVDIIKINYGNSINTTFKNTNSQTTISTFTTNLIVPIVVDNNNIFITGIDYSSNHLQLFPEANFNTLYSTTLKLGWTYNYSKHSQSTFIFLPKLASEYKNVSIKDMYWGAYFISKFKKHERFNIRIGAYASTEAFGLFTTPILGFYYLSANNKLEIDASLPITAKLNYSIKTSKVGIDFFALGRSYKITNHNYVEQSPIEFSTYYQIPIFNSGFWLKAKVGYATNSFKVYDQNDQLDFKVSAFNFGKNRTQLNPSLKGSPFIRIEAFYQFTISKSKQEEF